jgi:uncharacterized membrane protein
MTINLLIYLTFILIIVNIYFVYQQTGKSVCFKGKGEEKMINSKVSSIITYIPVIGFIICLAMGEKTEESKFNINQSISLSILMMVVSICGKILSFLPFIRLITNPVFAIAGLLLFVLAIIAAVMAATDSRLSIPVIKDIKYIK